MRKRNKSKSETKRRVKETSLVLVPKLRGPRVKTSRRRGSGRTLTEEREQVS